MATSAFGRRYPWTQSPVVMNGPMAGVAGTKLATAVSKAGGIGFIGAGVDMKKGAEALAEARTALAHLISSPEDPIPIGFGILCFGANLDEAIKNDYATWTTRIRESSKTPSEVWIQTSSVLSVVNLAKQLKPDVFVLQGSDAGGHGASPGASLISLVPEALDALKANGAESIPVVAAGGIADARGAAAAVVLGAAGVCIGTRFIASAEAQPRYAIYKDIILNTADGGYSTIRSQVFDHMAANGSIWPKTYDGRGLRNATTKDHDDGAGIAVLRGKFAEATGKDDGGFQTDVTTSRANIWAGTGVGLANEVLPAADIVQSVRNGVREILRLDN